jgi:hypothetical protein
MRLFRQYQDGDKMTQLRDTFSIRLQELDAARALMESIFKDVVSAQVPSKKPIQASGPATGQPTPTQGQPPATQAPQPAPLSAANLEKQTQALSKMHQRSNSKSGQPPAAPTTTQPPFQFGAQNSPTRQPIYLSKPAVTQDNLQQPPKKKQKNGPQQAQSPAMQVASAAAQAKPSSPEVKRQPAPEAKVPAKPSFLCPKPDCDMYPTGLLSEEALTAHIEEEHVKPHQNPLKFVQENLALSLGLDPQGHSLTPKSAPMDASQPATTTAGTSLSKQDHTPLIKTELASTPMSRADSMKRQNSTAAGKASESKGTPGKVVSVIGEKTPKPADGKLPTTKKEVDASQVLAFEEAWAPTSTTIDPQNLFSTFPPFESIAGGLISDAHGYRSVTPNDTPESSKDSGASEPNSDISEGANIDIDLQWQPFDADTLLDMKKVNIEGLDGLDSNLTGATDSYFQFTTVWDDMTTDFSKPFQLDTALYSMDTIEGFE